MTRINITHRLVITGDDALQFGDLGIRFSSKTEPQGKRQKTPLQVRGPHRQWLLNRRESTEIHHEYTEKFDGRTFYLLFKDELKGCEFKLRFL